jgi:hypothetical protein
MQEGGSEPLRREVFASASRWNQTLRERFQGRRAGVQTSLPTHRAGQYEHDCYLNSTVSVGNSSRPHAEMRTFPDMPGAPCTGMNSSATQRSALYESPIWSVLWEN